MGNKFHIYVIKLLLFFAILFVVDFISGELLTKLYFSQTSGLLYRTSYSLNETKADILIFGSSRANHHYHPQVISENTHCSYYNVGHDGMGILYQYAVLKAIIKRHHPKLIILDISSGQFSKENSEKERLAALLPYYSTHPEIRDILLLKSPFEKIKLVSKVYPYNSIIPAILVGNMEFNKKRKKDYWGFVPLPATDTLTLNQIKKRWESHFINKYNEDTLLINYFEKFITCCLHNKIKLLVVSSPYFTNRKFEDASIHAAQLLCKKYHINYADYSCFSEISDNPQYFKDPVHLNEEGAKYFSKFLLKDISNFVELPK